MAQRIASPWGAAHSAMLGPFYLFFHTDITVDNIPIVWF